MSKLIDNLTGRTELLKQLQHEREKNHVELSKLQGAVQYLVEDAMYEGAMPIDPGSLVGSLTEYDSQLINELIASRQWDIIGGLGAGLYTDFDQIRQRALNDARYLSVSAPLADWIIKVWTNYGMGDNVQIVANNEDANDVFQEFWTSSRNSDVLANDNLQYLSDGTVVDGNIFLTFFSDTTTGITTIDEIPMDEIVEIINNPNRSSEKLFYKRQFEANGETKVLYYPDWKAKFLGRLDKVTLPKDAKRTDMPQVESGVLNDPQNKIGTDVVVLHIAHNRKSRKSHMGWPVLTSASPYIKAHKRFMEDRLTVAASKAMYTRNKQIKGGSRAIDSVRSTLAAQFSGSSYRDGNPPGGAGSVELDNEAIKTTEKPMTTGASDAKTDWEMFSHQALIGGGLFPTTAGMDTSRWATALSMDKTLAMQWSRYQTFWASQFRRIVEIVLRFAELYGGQSFVDEDGMPQYGANVNIDTLSLVDFPDVVESLSKAVNSMLKPYLDNGIIPEQTAKMILRELWLIMLQALGLSASRDIASEDAFEIESEEFDMLPDPVKMLLNEAREFIKAGDVKGLVEFAGELSA